VGVSVCACECKRERERGRTGGENEDRERRNERAGRLCVTGTGTQGERRLAGRFKSALPQVNTIVTFLVKPRVRGSESRASQTGSGWFVACFFRASQTRHAAYTLQRISEPDPASR